MLEEVLALIEADFATLTLAGLAPEIEFAFGRRELKRNARPTRVVWVVERDPITAAGLIDDDMTGALSAVRTRNANISAHVWANSYAQAETIAHNLVTAGFRHLQGTGSFGDWSWVEQGEADWLTSGWGVIVPIVAYMPIAEEMMTIPTDPADPAENPDGNTEVTLVAGTPGENEANVVEGTATIDQDPTD